MTFSIDNKENILFPPTLLIASPKKETLPAPSPLPEIPSFSQTFPNGKIVYFLSELLKREEQYSRFSKITARTVQELYRIHYLTDNEKKALACTLNFTREEYLNALFILRKINFNSLLRTLILIGENIIYHKMGYQFKIAEPDLGNYPFYVGHEGVFIFYETIGKGSSKKVQMGLKLDDGSHCVRAVVKGAKKIERFRHEIILQSLFNHEAIIPPYYMTLKTQVEEEKLQAFGVYFQASGAELIKSGPRFEKFLNIFKDVGSGLAYIHANKFVHSDLKPANILCHFNPVDQIYFSVLSDLGTTNNIGHLRLGGTESYIPYEATLNGYRLMPSYDLWSYGVTLLSFVLPYEAKKIVPRRHSQELVDEYLQWCRKVVESTWAEEAERAPRLKTLDIARLLLQVNPEHRISADQAADLF